MFRFERCSGAMSRRQFLQGGLALGGSLALGGPGALAQVVRDRGPFTNLKLTAKPMAFSILPGAPTNTWSYEGFVKGGPALARVGYLGPILRLPQGSYLSVDFLNALPEDTTVHWHGLDVPAIMDGHPIMAVQPGGRYNYAYRIFNRAGTYWFHPHPHMRTGYQVCQGLAGVLIVTDPEEQALALPRGDRDLLFVLQDRNFDSNNQIVYTIGPATGYLGNRMVVNGQVDAIQEVVTGVYRIRLLNGSNARMYKLEWSTGEQMVVIGCDHGLLRAPEIKPYVMLAPGERVELWVDFRGASIGSTIKLRNTMTVGGTDLLEFRVTASVNDPIQLPQTLSQIPTYQLSQAANVDNPRVITVSRVGTEWRLNDRSFEMNSVEPYEVTRRGQLEVWEFRNDVGSNLIPHPMHLHGSPFQVVERTISSYQSSYNLVREGFIDSGWKDTFILMPGERVKILTKPQTYTGRFIYHCHNLEHEDMGMMRNYDIIP